MASLDGTPTVTLIDTANTTSADWSDDGWIYVEGGAGILRVRPTGGPVEPVYAVSAARHEIGAEFLNALPGGGLLYRLRYGGKGQNEFQIAAMKVPGGSPKLLTRGVFARYAPGGHLLVVTADGKLIALPFDAAKLAVTGPAERAARGCRRPRGRVQHRPVALAERHPGVHHRRRRRLEAGVWVSREGVPSLVDASWDPQGTVDAFALSPDEKTLAVALLRNGKRDIWVKALPTGPFSRITFGDTGSTRPVWAPDGRSLLYVQDRAGSGVGPVYEHRADGTGNATPVFHGAMDWGQIVPARDRRWLVLRSASSTGNAGIFGRAPGRHRRGAAGRERRLDQRIPGAVTRRALAGLLVGRVRDTRRSTCGPSPGPARPSGRSRRPGGTQPAWSKRGRQLYYLNGKNDLVAAEIRPGATFGVGEEHVLFSTAPFVRLGPIPSFAVTADDRRFLMLREGESAQESELIVALHWLDGLEQKAGK